MTLRSQIEEAAFWGGYACVACAQTKEEGEAREEGLVCSGCGAQLTPASDLVALLARVEADEQGD